MGKALIAIVVIVVILLLGCLLVFGQYVAAVVHDVRGSQRPRPHYQQQEFVGHLSGASPLGPRTRRWRDQTVQLAGLGRG